MSMSSTESSAGRFPDDPAWRSDEEPPSSWVAFLPDARAPDREDVAQAITAWLGGEARMGQAENPDADPGMIWNLVVEVPSVDAPVVIWAERAATLSAPPRHGADEAMARCPWVIRMQAQLGAREPAADYFVLTSLLAGVLPDAVAMLDIASGIVYERAALDEWFLDPEARPNERWLWSVLGLTSGSGGTDAPASHGMLFTTGLRRCGRPELELLDLPIQNMDAGVALLHAIAGWLLEVPIPAPGAPLEIGPGMVVTLQPWQVVAKQLAADAPGSEASRASIAGDGPALDGLRAVVCGAAPEGDPPTQWRWPHDVISRLESGHAVFFSSAKRAEATAARARRTWPDFATAFASLRRAEDPALRSMAQRSFLVQAPIAPEGVAGDASHEQAWFRVEGFDAGMIRASLCTQSLTRPELSAGHAVRLQPSEVRDWRVSLDARDFGPDDPAALLAEIDRLRGVA